MSTSQNHKIAANVLTLSTAKQVPKKNPPPSQLQYPPRYQPPPQPPGGILKGTLSAHLKRQTASYYHSDHAASQPGPKYPAGAFLPEKTPSRIVPPRVQLRLSQGGTAPGAPAPATGQRIAGPPPPPPPPAATTDEEPPFARLSASAPPTQEMLKFVRKPDSEQPSPTSSSGGRISSAEHNRHLQSLIAELRALKEVNQRLSDDNQELRDLCCFLDDDRQKSRKLSREWHRFGRYTASVMRQEVSAYQNKLRQLDDKQQELIRDNLELKDLCLYLDEERANATSVARVCSNCGATMEPVVRDDGDGSSSSTNADEPMIRNFERSIPELNIRPTITDQTLQYVRSLERRIRQLEEENTRTTPTPQAAQDPISGRPEAVVRALQVLEVREQLERDHRHRGHVALDSASPSVPMDDGEKALVREMCNVMWRNGGKLDDTSSNEPEMDC
ncbi:coiled-coil domain-containing protein 85C [Phlebotomus argentipes]|uniref:coiled-coil domain-containing protein 85C n=1 Tax=Phlebotomus argentipes TaxID=94469 RepID=UPI0028936C90|nr:coiled-coil domain-containing protein 85C [Phlebotomus argentipes]